MTRKEYESMIRAVRDGDIIRVKRGVYASLEALLSTDIDVDKIVPGGILCLYSAWAYHHLTTQIPDKIYVAIENKRKVVLPEFPVIQPVYISKSILDLGMETRNEGGFTTRIYDCERSVCDAIKYRNKIGIDVMAEILRTYLSKSNRDIKKLTEYASKLRVGNILNQYLQIYL